MIKKSKVPALAAILVSLSGLAASPDFLGILPDKSAATVSLLGILFQAISKSITDKD